MFTDECTDVNMVGLWSSILTVGQTLCRHLVPTTFGKLCVINISLFPHGLSTY